MRSSDLTLADQRDAGIGHVTTLITTPGGSAIVRVRNDFAAGIVLTDARGGSFVDEGLAVNIGRPALRGDRAVWRHGSTLRSAPKALADTCPRAPTPAGPYGPLGGYLDGRGSVLATLDAVTSNSWFCLRATGRIGRLDGVVVRLLGALAVVRRPNDVRVVDLRSGATLSGPVAVAADVNARPTVSAAGTLVLLLPVPAPLHNEIVAVAAGKAASVIAGGDLRAPRYEDGILRYTDATTLRTIDQALA